MPSVAMRTWVLLLILGVGFAMFGSGESLQCYSCPGGSSSSCDVKESCRSEDDSCLKLTHGETVYTGCMRYSECNFRTLAVRYPVPDFDFTCCQSDLCNSQHKSFFERMFG